MLCHKCGRNVPEVYRIDGHLREDKTFYVELCGICTRKLMMRYSRYFRRLKRWAAKSGIPIGG